MTESCIFLMKVVNTFLLMERISRLLPEADVTVDAEDDIVLDANGADIFFKDDGTTFGSATNTSGNLIIKSGTTTALTFSGANVTAAGTVAATGAVTANAGVNVDNINIDGTEIDLSSGDLTVDVAGDISLDAGGADVIIKDDGTAIGTFTNSSSDFVVTANVQDKDIIFKGDDGGSAITALTMDMSEAGAASFNGAVTAAGIVTANAGVDIDNINIDGTEIDLSFW